MYKRKATLFSLAAAVFLSVCALNANAAHLAHAASVFDFGPLGIGAAVMGIGSLASQQLADKDAKTEWFRIAVEGATTDGRNIAREWITQAAKNYNPTLYAARVNCEHIRGLSADGPFRMYGDVLALEAREESGVLAGKMGLYAQLKPTAELVAINKQSQKLYTSCEFSPSFADTKEAYLVGLAVTDTPASLGTQMLQFAAQHPDVLKHRKQHPDNLFTVAEETTITFSEQKPDVLAPLKSMVARLSTLMGKKEHGDDDKFSQLTAAVGDVVAVAEKQNEALTAATGTITELTKRVDELTETGKKDRAELDSLFKKLSMTPNEPGRPITSGKPDQQHLTNC